MHCKLFDLFLWMGLAITGWGQAPLVNMSYIDTAAYMGRFRRLPFQHFQGMVVLKNGDTLSGYMQIIRNRCALLTPDDRYRYIKPKAIKKVELQISSFYRKPTELYSINQKHMRGVFWRKIATKGNFAVYDRSEGIFADSTDEIWANNTCKNRFNEFMYIVSSDNHVEKIYGRFSIFSGVFLVDNKAREKLLKYINRKFKKKFKQSDFETEMQMLDYLLNHRPPFPVSGRRTRTY